ncbi:MAG: hypothetical protein OXF54_22075 [Caldilineaceae bacterium]|nr:hypothetical protein [Caldilineaceae bacterium]
MQLRVAGQDAVRPVSGGSNSSYPARKSSMALRALRYWVPMRLAWSETLSDGDETEVLMMMRNDVETVDAGEIPKIADRRPEWF